MLINYKEINMNYILYSALLMLFVTLKLFQLTEYSWIWILCPIWLPLLITLLWETAKGENK